MSARHVGDLVSKHRAKGIVVDANLLLLYFLGSYDPERIPRYKRTRVYTIDDFRMLKRFLHQFASLVTTPNILTEVSNLSTQLPEDVRRSYFEEFMRQVGVLDEQYLPSDEVVQNDLFGHLGLTDTAIADLSKRSLLVLTDDFKLAGRLHSLEIDVINFNHIRAWDRPKS